MIISEIIGRYSQTIKIGSKNEVQVYKNGKLLFKGEANHIFDNGNKLSFTDKKGSMHEFIKYLPSTSY